MYFDYMLFFLALTEQSVSWIDQVLSWLKSKKSVSAVILILALKISNQKYL